MTEIKTRPDEMAQYVKMGFQLIPLHMWDKRSVHKGKARDDGKRPLHSDWTKKLYKNEDVLKHVKGGGNAGVRLTASQLVIDVDPRNFPLVDPNGPADGPRTDTFAKLCSDFGIDPSKYPKVDTGSGGIHLYMAKPADVAVVDSLEAYQGVEFKTKGRQVVAAGSRHPNGRLYEWDFLNPDLLGGLSLIPERLLGAIRRPVRSIDKEAAEGGEHDQERIAIMLDGLDPEEFQEHEKWLQLMMAVHHASGGTARDEFIEWSTRDPKYQADGWMIGRRWDSLHTKKQDGSPVTYRTLHKLLRDKGKEDLIPRVSAREDFQDLPEDVELPGDDELGEIPEHEQRGPLSRMNQRYWAVMDGGKFRVMHEVMNPSEGRKHWVSASKQDFMDMLANRRIEKMVKDAKGKDKVEIIPVAKAWLEWGHRRDAQGVIFDPQRDHPGWLNLWTGWAIEPKPGDWSLTRELIDTVLCDGDPEAADYVVKWMAYMVQKPWEPAEVAICFHGKKGTGKSTLGQALVALAGRHGLQTSSPGHLTGRFNSHLMDVVMLFADEAVRPSDRDAVNAIKALITERDMAYEAKGRDVKRGTNRVHVMMASNDDWFVSAGATDGERRYFVSKVSDRRRGDKAFFSALKSQLYGPQEVPGPWPMPGLQAMMHDLMTMDLGEWTPRGNIPNTEALTDQKLRNMDIFEQWWFNQLEAGELAFPATRDGVDWSKERVRGFYQDVKESFESHALASGLRANSQNRGTDRYFHAALEKVCPNVVKEQRDPIPEDRAYAIKPAGNSGRGRCFEFPILAQCRADFEELLGAKIAWSVAAEDPLDA